MQVSVISEHRATGQEMLNLEREARERIERASQAEQDLLKKQVEAVSDENKSLKVQLAAAQDNIATLNAKVVELEARDKERHDAINEATARETDRDVYYTGLRKSNELAISKLEQLAQSMPDLKDWLAEHDLKVGSVNAVMALTAKLRDKDSAIQSRDEHIARLNNRNAELETLLGTKGATQEVAVGESAAGG